MFKNSFTLSVLTLFLFYQSALRSQNNGPFTYELEQAFREEVAVPEQKSDREFLRTWQEHIVLHLDKNNLDKNEPLFFKAYILTGPEKVRATLSKVLRMELLNGSGYVVSTRYYRITDGMAQGAFLVPKRMDEGKYTLQVYTQWMRNYGKDSYYRTELIYGEKNGESINDEGESDALSVSFYPEGGKLVENLDNLLLIKTIDQNGNSIHVEGELVDSNGTVVNSVKPYGEGIASVKFIPRPGEIYTFRTKSGQSFALPNIDSEGYLINLNALNPENLTLKVQASPQLVGSTVWLNGVMDGMEYFRNRLDIKDRETVIEIPKKDIPSGILEVQLSGLEETIFATRPVAIESKKLNISITSNEGGDGVGNGYTISVTDLAGRPVETDLSFSISKMASMDVENPIITGKNLDAGSSKRIGKLDRANLFKKDLEVLTSLGGIDKIRPTNLPESIIYPFQSGLHLYGHVYNLNNELLTNTSIQIYGASNDDIYVKEVETDATGMLKLEDLQFDGETELVFRTEGDDTKSRLVKFIPLEETLGKVDKGSLKKEDEVPKIRKGAIVQSTQWEPIDQDRLVVLDEVSVSEKKLKNRKSTPSVYGIEPSRVVYQDFKRPKSIPQLFLGIPGVQVRGLGGLYPSVILPRAAGAGPVLWVVDGMPLAQPGNKGYSSGFREPSQLFEIMSIVSHVDIERIEILFGAQASIYGSRANGGAILIYTRSGALLDSVKRKEAYIKFQGYSDSPTFESYMESVDKKSKKFREGIKTLHWSPNLTTNANGEAFVNIGLSEKNTSILMLEAKAVTKKGMTGELRMYTGSE